MPRRRNRSTRVYCPFSERCQYIVQDKLKRNSCCWWFSLGWCQSEKRYQGYKPQHIIDEERKAKENK